jgi:hypothetical protein
MSVGIPVLVNYPDNLKTIHLHPTITQIIHYLVMADENKTVAWCDIFIFEIKKN